MFLKRKKKIQFLSCKIADIYTDKRDQKEEDMSNWTICLAFEVAALRSAKGDSMQLFELITGENWRERIALSLKVDFDHAQFHEASLTIGIGIGKSVEFSSFSLLTWIQACISSSDRNITLALNGLVVGAHNLSSTRILRRGNLTLNLGKSMTGSLTGVNMFNPAASVEDMKGLTSSKGKDCGKPGTFLNWVDFSSTVREGRIYLRRAEGLRDWFNVIKVFILCQVLPSF